MSASVCKIIRIFSCFVYSVGTRKEKYILIWWQLLAIAKRSTKNGSKTLPKKCRYVHFALWDFSCFCFKAINPKARGYFKNIAKYRLDTLKFHNYKKQNRVSILQCPGNIFRISYWNLLYYRPKVFLKIVTIFYWKYIFNFTIIFSLPLRRKILNQNISKIVKQISK